MDQKESTKEIRIDRSEPSCDRGRVIKYQMVGSQGGSSADGGIYFKKEIERLSEKSLGPELKY